MGKNINQRKNDTRFRDIHPDGSTGSLVESNFQRVLTFGQKYWFIFVSILVFFFFSTTFAGSSNLQDEYDARKVDMLVDDALVWAWCEKCESNFNYYNDLIWNHLDDVWKQYLSRSRRQGMVHMVRGRYQYPQCFTQAQIEWIDDYLEQLFQGGLYGIDAPWKGAASANQQISTLSSMYLVAEDHPEYTIDFVQDAEGIWKEFSYEGRSYSRGNTYNLLAFSRDYLHWLFEQYVEKKNYTTDYWDYTGEMDVRTYTISQLKALLMLRDLALDETIAKKADMVFTLVLLNNKMDFSAKQLGGSLGMRTYAYRIGSNFGMDFNWGIFGDWTDYKYVWEDPSENPSAPWDYSIRFDSQSVAMVSTKPFDPILLEIGNTDNEPQDAYAHLHIEQNMAKGKWNFVGGEVDSANWTYATKYYNLGGNRNEWVLQVPP